MRLRLAIVLSIIAAVALGSAGRVSLADHGEGHEQPPGCERRSEDGREHSPNCQATPTPTETPTPTATATQTPTATPTATPHLPGL